MTPDRTLLPPVPGGTEEITLGWWQLSPKLTIGIAVGGFAFGMFLGWVSR